MTAIDWTYAGSLGGEYVESFAATCLRQKFDDALQTKPAQGDGGIDVYRKTSDGLVVWQIKKFTTPLTASQKRQVGKSWKRFWSSHVEVGEKIAKYHLATPWTPTDEMRQWFIELTEDATFPVQWDGESFFNALASEFPATATRFFKGDDALETMVLSKSVLASSPVENASDVTMLDALRARETALREIRDLASDNYVINTGTRTLRSDPPLPGRDEVGVVHRFTRLDGNRYQVESVVPRNAQSLEVEPISLTAEFEVEPGSADEAKLREWSAWGVPFRDVPGRIVQTGGPFADEAPGNGLLSFLPVDEDHDYPDLVVRVTASVSDDAREVLALRTTEVTRGVSGGGLRIVARSPSGVFELEMRHGSTQEPSSTDVRIGEIDGTYPTRVERDLLALKSIDPAHQFEISLSSGLSLAYGHGFRTAGLPDALLDLCRDLRVLQEACETRIVLAPVDEMTNAQVETVHGIAELYRGVPRITQWTRIVMTVDRPEETRASLAQVGSIVRVIANPVVHLGQRDYELTRSISETAHSVALGPGVDLDQIQKGDEIELVAGEDNRVTTAAFDGHVDLSALGKDQT